MSHCPRCGTAVGRTDAYCGGCGERLPDGQSDGEPDQAATPRRDDTGHSPVERPEGIKLVCGLLAILGITSAIGGLALLQARTVLAAPVGGAGGGPGLAAALALCLGGGYLAATYGMWTPTDWAWPVTIGVLAVGAVYHLVSPAGAGSALFAALASAGLCAYLLTSGERFRPAVRSGATGATG